MHRYHLIVASLFLCGISARALAGQQTLSRRDRSALIRTAHTEEEFGRLEAYYELQAKQFSELERLWKEQMDRALQTSVYSKYPSECERSRNLWMYYTSRREQATAAEELYREKKNPLRHDAEHSPPTQTRGAETQP